MCGAVSHELSILALLRGSSPRVRSGLQPDDRQRMGRGIISACAERSLLGFTPINIGRDHLRVCGAVLLVPLEPDYQRGSSPRVRSGPRLSFPGKYRIGIISACAERSHSGHSSAGSSGDHLRVCGAVGGGRCYRRHDWGSSPRVRSGPSLSLRVALPKRIISACAERSHQKVQCRWHSRDHLRVCGAVAGV